MSRLPSFDERQAFEAAFSGRPPQPHWSARAREIYDGTLKARGFDPAIWDDSPPSPPPRYVLWHVIVTDPLQSCSLLFPERFSSRDITRILRRLFPGRSFSFRRGPVVVPLSDPPLS